MFHVCVRLSVPLSLSDTIVVTNFLSFTFSTHFHSIQFQLFQNFYLSYLFSGSSPSSTFSPNFHHRAYTISINIESIRIGIQESGSPKSPKIFRLSIKILAFSLTFVQLSLNTQCFSYDECCKRKIPCFSEEKVEKVRRK